MTIKRPEWTEYICTWCGAKIKSCGRPAPGNCPRKGKDSNGRPKPHTWVKNT
mgnify:CR=1 FL=1